MQRLTLAAVLLAAVDVAAEDSVGDHCDSKDIANWTEFKQVFCCEQHEVGCRFDCRKDYRDWEETWSEHKKEWCCENKKLGCHAFKLKEQPFDCQKNYWDRAEWSQHQKDWCCRNKQLGCFMPTTTEKGAASTTETVTGTATKTNTSTTQTGTTVSSTVTAIPSTTSHQKKQIIAHEDSTLPPTTQAPTSTVTTTTPKPTTTPTAAPTTTSAEVTTTQKSSKAGEETSCFEDQIAWDPLDMPGTAPRNVKDATECQELCANTTGCVHFSYWWIGKNCHLQDAYAVQQKGRLGFISGPFGCWDTLDKSKYIKKSNSTFVHKEFKCIQLGTLYTPLMGLSKHFPKPFARNDDDHVVDDKDDTVNAVKECRHYCAQTKDCAYFTMVFPQRLCRMAGAGAHKLQPYLGAVSGTPTCWAGKEHDVSDEELLPQPALAPLPISMDDGGKLKVVMKNSLRAGVPRTGLQPLRMLGTALVLCAVAAGTLGLALVVARRVRKALPPNYSTVQPLTPERGMD